MLLQSRAARCLHQVRLDLAQNDQAKAVHLEADYASMKHLLGQLEAAVAEERSVHARRFQRYIQ